MKEKKILIVISDYYEEISLGLLKGATDFLNKNNAKYNIIKVSGCFEIPYVINKIHNDYDGIISLGCVIRGETYHFELIANEVARKIMDLTINLNKPIGFGILTCDNINLAKKRSSNNEENKGREASEACLNSIINTEYFSPNK